MRQGDTRDLAIEHAPSDMRARSDLGASIACSGVCSDGGRQIPAGRGWLVRGRRFSGETHLAHRVAGPVEHKGCSLNLERALRLGEELGGHIVTGHVDGIGEIVSIKPRAISLRIETPAGPGAGAEIAPCSRPSGIDHARRRFAHRQRSRRPARRRGPFRRSTSSPTPQAVTTFGTTGKPGRQVNIEIDVLARYLATHGAFHRCTKEA